MNCVFCDAEAAAAADPRIPLLRIPSCWDCRDRLAYFLGWTRTGRSKTFWGRGERQAEVVR